MLLFNSIVTQGKSEKSNKVHMVFYSIYVSHSSHFARCRLTEKEKLW